MKTTVIGQLLLKNYSVEDMGQTAPNKCSKEDEEMEVFVYHLIYLNKDRNYIIEDK